MQDEIYIHDLKTGARVERLSADFIGAAMVDGHRSGSHFFATLTGFNTPGTVMVYDDNAKEKWSRYRQAEVAGLNLDDFEAQQVRTTEDQLLWLLLTLRWLILLGLVQEQGRHQSSHVHCTTQIDSVRRHGTCHPIRYDTLLNIRLLAHPDHYTQDTEASASRSIRSSALRF